MCYNNGIIFIKQMYQEVFCGFSKNKKNPKREEIDAKYKWKLEDIYQSMDLWERTLRK